MSVGIKRKKFSEITDIEPSFIRTFLFVFMKAAGALPGPSNRGNIIKNKNNKPFKNHILSLTTLNLK